MKRGSLRSLVRLLHSTSINQSGRTTAPSCAFLLASLPRDSFCSALAFLRSSNAYPIGLLHVRSGRGGAPCAAAAWACTRNWFECPFVPAGGVMSLSTAGSHSFPIQLHFRGPPPRLLPGHDGARQEERQSGQSAGAAAKSAEGSSRYEFWPQHKICIDVHRKFS